MSISRLRSLNLVLKAMQGLEDRQTGCERSSGAASGRAPGGLTPPSRQEPGSTRPHPPSKETCEEAEGAPASCPEPCAGGWKPSSRRAVDVCFALRSARIWKVPSFCTGCAPSATRPDTYNSQTAEQIKDKEKRAAEPGSPGYQMIPEEGCGFRLCDCQEKA